MSERFGQDLILLEKLAAGGMAEVFRAKQIGYGGFEKTVAVKRILPNFASDEEFKGMFRQEANLSAGLQHQSIVQVFGNGEHEGYLYLVMEFVDGKNVRQLLSRCERKKKRIPVELSLFMVAETAKGLQYAHNYHDEKSGQPLNIVHRDMSPQNIMVGYDASVKIVDFGIAKAASWADNTRAGVLKGKFGYMSPEQARGEKLDSRTDIFALGIILFETLTQRRLFTSDDDLRTIKMVKDCNVPRPSKYNPSITSQLDRIVLKALEKNKADRYQHAQELYEDIIVYLNQKFPKFVPTELSKFIKELFKEDIEEFKKKREKQAAEAPATSAAGQERQEPARKNPVLDLNLNDKDKTEHSGVDEEKTQLSESNADVVEKEAPYPQSLDIPILGDKEPRVDPKIELSPEENNLAFETAKNPELSFTSSGVLPNPEPKVESSIQQAKGFPTVKTNTELGYEPEIKLEDDIPELIINEEIQKPNNRMRLYLVAALLLLAIGFVIKQGEIATQPAADVSIQPPVEAHIEAKVDVPVDVPPVLPVDRPPASVSSQITLREIQGPSGPYGRVRINTIPRSDEFYLNGKLVVDESGRPFKIEGQDLLLPPGEFQVELKNLAFEKQWAGSIQIKADVRQEKDIVFK